MSLLDYAIFQRLTSGPVPLLFWTGYSAPILVASENLRDWTVPGRPSPANPAPMLLPRRWYDVHGDLIDRVWRGSLRCVVGWVWNRPGMSLVSCSFRFLSIFSGMAKG